MLEIRKASLENLQDVTKLFNLYRIFYKQDDNLKETEKFIEDRLIQQDSVIYLAFVSGEPAGFMQLYPIFSSVSMKKLWLLNDLYVNASARKNGIGKELLNKAKQLAMDTRAKGLILETEESNKPAQKLYQREGFIRNQNQFYCYDL